MRLETRSAFDDSGAGGATAYSTASDTSRFITAGITVGCIPGFTVGGTVGGGPPCWSTFGALAKSTRFLSRAGEGNNATAWSFRGRPRFRAIGTDGGT